MIGTVLAVDAGNTRIKWGTHDGARWLHQGWVETTRVTELTTEFAAMPPPQTVVVSNVAGDALQLQLAAVLPAFPAPRWIASLDVQ